MPGLFSRSLTSSQRLACFSDFSTTASASDFFSFLALSRLPASTFS